MPQRILLVLTACALLAGCRIAPSKYFETDDEGWLVLRPMLTRELASRELGTPDTMRYLPVLFPNLPPPKFLEDYEQDEDEEEHQGEKDDEG